MEDIYLDLISLGIIFPVILIKKELRYNVMPIGIKTTTPAIKLFLILAKIDFFIFFCQTCIMNNLSK